MGDEEVKYVKTILYPCPACGEQREVGLTALQIQAIEKHYRTPGAAEMSLDDPHLGKVEGKDNVYHIIQVNVDQNLKVRRSNAVFRIPDAEGEVTKGKYSSIIEPEEKTKKAIVEEIIYPEYKEILEQTKIVYGMAKKIIKSLPKETAPGTKILHYTDIKRSKYEDGKEVSKDVTYKELLSKRDELKDRLKCEKKKLKSGNEIVWLEIYKTRQEPIPKQSKEDKLEEEGGLWKRADVTPIHIFPQQKPSENCKKAITGALTKLAAMYTDIGKENPFFVWTNVSRKELGMLEGSLEVELDKTEQLESLAFEYTRIVKARDDKKNKKYDVINVPEKGKMTREKIDEEIKNLKTKAGKLTENSLQSIEIKGKRRRGTERSVLETITGLGVAGTGGALEILRQYLINTYSKLAEWYGIATEIGVDPTKEETEAYNTVQFSTYTMPWIELAAIVVGGVIAGVGIHKMLKRRSNEDRYGFKDGWADYNELVYLIEANEEVKKKLIGEAKTPLNLPLINFKTERPDVLINELYEWKRILGTKVLVETKKSPINKLSRKE